MASSAFFPGILQLRAFISKKKLQPLFFLLPSAENLPEEKP
jgi:hypothetical protein